MKKIYIVCFLLLVSRLFPVFSQSNLLIDVLLREKQATFGKSVYLILTSSEIISERTPIVEALEELGAKNWGFRAKKESDLLTMGELSLLLMQAFDLPGGIMYSLVPVARYAYREMKHLKIIKDTKGPGNIVSGETVVHAIGNVLAWKEEYE